MRRILPIIVTAVFTLSCSSIHGPSYKGPFRSFESSFESISDFNDFYIVPPGDYQSSHELSSENPLHGQFSHKAWIVNAGNSHNDGPGYFPHRAYPTIQLQKTTDGIFRTPCLVTLWVYLDINLINRPPGTIDDWFSFITLSPDASDNWSRTVLANLVFDGYVHLAHVPDQGKQEYLFQADRINDPEGLMVFPMNQWVRLDLLIDFDADRGYAKLWQNGTLISHALVKGGDSGLAQAHFGLYASAAVSSGTIYNDRLRLIEVSDEDEATLLVQKTY